MKIIMTYYNFYIILLYFTYTIVRMCISNDTKYIFKQFIKAIIISPIIVSMYFAKI